jgi:membrane-associated phospholipid phosphatase
LVEPKQPADRGGVPRRSGPVLIMAAAALFCILVFAFLALELQAGGLTGFDSALSDWVRAGMNPGLTRLMILVTGMGGFKFITTLTALAVITLFALRRWGEGLGVAFASLISWRLFLYLKLVFQRPRPELPHLAPATGYSFPSGHAAVTAALFIILALVYAHRSGRRSGRAAMLVAALLVLLVGISRVYLGVHHPSDVVAGWAQGALVALVISLLLRLDDRA